MKNLIILLSMSLIFLTGCATFENEGKITRIESEKEAILPVFPDQIKAGDTVNVYKHGCYSATNRKGKNFRGPINCRYDFVGSAKVVEVNEKNKAHLSMIGDGKFSSDMYAYKEDQATFEAKKKQAQEEAKKFDPNVYKYEYP